MQSSLDPALLGALDRAIDDRAEEAFGFLERLVAAPSTAGTEMPAQQVARGELGLLLGGACAVNVGTFRTGDWPSSVPALAHGPRTRNIHATDEAVELESIVAGARTLARFLAGYYATGGLPAGSPR